MARAQTKICGGAEQGRRQRSRGGGEGPHKSHELGRGPGNDATIRHGLEDEAPRGNLSAVSNEDVAEDGRVGANQHAITNLEGEVGGEASGRASWKVGGWGAWREKREQRKGGGGEKRNWEMRKDVGGGQSVRQRRSCGLTLGWRSPLTLPVPPRVTPCRREQLFPTTAVSPMTIPVPWSRRTPMPIFVAGWMSTERASLICRDKHHHGRQRWG